MKNRDFLKVTAKENDVSKTGKNEFGFEINVDFFNGTATKSLGMVKLQRSKYNDFDDHVSKLLYINWNKANRCLFTPALTGEKSMSFTFPIKLLIWISKAGNLNVNINGKYMSLDSGCNVDMWSDVNRVKVTLFDMRSIKRTTDQLFEMSYEIYHTISTS